ncbi:MAG: helix-turn-helix domain-containing protein [Burkholderiaceae bacterium]
MSYPIRLPDQLKQHLRSLRKSHGMTQAQLGALVGVKQARIAEIEADPGAVSLGQLTRILAALGGTLHLYATDIPESARARLASPAPTIQQKATEESSKKAASTRRRAATTARSKPRTKVVIGAKKGSW